MYEPRSIVVRSGAEKMAGAGDKSFVALQLHHDDDDNALRVGLAVRLDMQIEAMGPADHVLTCVSLRIDRLSARIARRKRESKKAPIQGYTVCDPGGVLGLPGYLGLELIIDGLMQRSGAHGDLLGEVSLDDEEE